jgi:hypothetical protein
MVSDEAAAGRVLVGYRAIGDHLGIGDRRAKYWADQGWIPTFRMGDLMCARTTDLDKAIAERASNPAKAEPRARGRQADLPSAASLLRPRRR